MRVRSCQPQCVPLTKVKSGLCRYARLTEAKQEEAVTCVSAQLLQDLTLAHVRDIWLLGVWHLSKERLTRLVNQLVSLAANSGWRLEPEMHLSLHPCCCKSAKLLSCVLKVSP